MKVIITESQQESLKNKLQQVVGKFGMGKAIKSVGGLENLVKILYGGDYDLFVNHVLEDMESNTHRSDQLPYHYYLFDCNVSVMLDHSSTPPVFVYRPKCFENIVEEKYDVDEVWVCDFLWERYSDYVIDRYQFDNRRRNK